MSQSRLGALVDMPQSRVSTVESGGHQVEKLDVIVRIAESLKMTSSARRIIGLADIDDARPVSEYDLAAGFSAAYSWEDHIDVAGALWRDDMNRRTFLVRANYAAQVSTAAAFFWTAGLGHERERISKTGSREVGPADVEAIEEMIGAFRRNESRFGGARIRPTFVHFLGHDVEPLLKDGSYNDEVGRRLFSVVADGLLLAAWMAYDIEQNGLAQQYFVAALHLAHDGSNNALAGEVMAAMAHQSLHMGNPREAINLSRSAQEAARKSGVGALLSECCLLEANGLAMLGEEKPSIIALRRAETALDRADRTSEPTWMSFYDSSYLAARSARCFRDLGRLSDAEPLAYASLKMDPHYTRGRSFNLALLASIKAGRGDVGGACAIGVEAIDLMSTVRSSRSRRYVEEINRALRPVGRSAATDEYRRVARQILAPT